MVQGPIFLGAIHFDIPCQPADYPLSWLEKTPYQFAEKNLNLLECFAQLRTFLNPQLRYGRKFDLQVPVFVKACPSFDYPLPTPKELPALGRKLLVLLRNWGLLLLNSESAEGKSTRKGHRPVSFVHFQYCLTPWTDAFANIRIEMISWYRFILDLELKLSHTSFLFLSNQDCAGFMYKFLAYTQTALSTSSYQIVYLVLPSTKCDTIYHTSLYVQ